MRRHSPIPTLAVALALMAIVSTGCVLRPPVAPTPSTSACTGGVRITAGADPQRIVDAHPAGTSYTIGTGTHLGFSVTPQTGDRFCGEPGAILDGRGSTERAFDAFGSGQADNVTVQGAGGKALLQIRNYRPGSDLTDFRGAIEGNNTGECNSSQNWLIRYTDMHHNYPVAITVGDGTQVRDSKLHDNSTLGISSGCNQNITIDHNEIYGNNSSQDVSCNFEAGGVKLSVGDHITFSNNYSHDNGCDGLWNDLGYRSTNSGNKVINNILIHNGGQGHGSGSHYEISGGPCTISGNYARDNNYDGEKSNFFVGGQIFLSNGSGCEVANNTLVGPKGVVLVDDTRSECSPSQCSTNNNNIHDNSFYFNGDGLIAGGQCDSSVCDRMTGNRWNNNHYHYPNLSDDVFSWPTDDIDRGQWQRFGFDTNGTFDTNTAPPPPPAWSL